MRKLSRLFVTNDHWSVTGMSEYCTIYEGSEQTLLYQVEHTWLSSELQAWARCRPLGVVLIRGPPALPNILFQGLYGTN